MKILPTYYWVTAQSSVEFDYIKYGYAFTHIIQITAKNLEGYSCEQCERLIRRTKE